MADPVRLDLSNIEPSRLVLIVTGAHLRAEIGDRPIAYAMRDTILDRLSRRPEDERLGVLVCSDIWYLNNDELRACPTISIGGPGVNALAAFLVERLPSAFTVKDVLTVQMDTDFVDLIASCWGHGTAPTRSAAEAFIARYLDLFLEKAVLRAV